MRRYELKAIGSKFNRLSNYLATHVDSFLREWENHLKHDSENMTTAFSVLKREVTMLVSKDQQASNRSLENVPICRASLAARFCPAGLRGWTHLKLQYKPAGPSASKM